MACIAQLEANLLMRENLLSEQQLSHRSDVLAFENYVRINDARISAVRFD